MHRENYIPIGTEIVVEKQINQLNGTSLEKIKLSKLASILFLLFSLSRTF